MHCAKGSVFRQNAHRVVRTADPGSATSLACSIGRHSSHRVVQVCIINPVDQQGCSRGRRQVSACIPQRPQVSHVSDRQRCRQQ
eukprot:354850-Chlamydomonas_euryale.AAC.3